MSGQGQRFSSTRDFQKSSRGRRAAAWGVSAIAMRIEEIRTGVGARLRARHEEIEQAILTRVHGVSERREIADPAYAEGLRAAVAEAVSYGISSLERSEDHSPPFPTVLLTQARLAARNGVKLEDCPAPLLRRLHAAR